MFRRFAGSIPEGAEKLFRQHPLMLATLLEEAWRYRADHANLSLGRPGRRSGLGPQPTNWLDLLATKLGIHPPDLAFPPGEFEPARGIWWDHLIYAYMIENTRIYEIFRRVLFEFLHGEKLGTPTVDTQHWLRNTEELFYHDAPAYSIMNIDSHIRPDMRATRRNAYWRMFGMDLNHGTHGGGPYPYTKADAHNGEFVTTFEEFLREAWVAIANRSNQSGPNPTDNGKLQNLVDNLRDMLMTRRSYGNLSREEFVAVTTMSWFHLTVQYDFPVIHDLKAEASSPEQRLFKIAQQAGLPAHGLSKSYFDIADPISHILIMIESGGLDDLPQAPTTPFSDQVQADLSKIITHWSIITGRDVKAGKVAVR